MIAFKIGTWKGNLPTCWGDVMYIQYIALLVIPDTIIHKIHLFTGISLDILEKADIKNLERIVWALSFMNTPPEMTAEPTGMVGKYTLPKDITIQSVGQFEDLRTLLNKFPRNEDGSFPQSLTIEENLLISDLYLTACAIYVQKIKDGKYDFSKVEAVKEELKNESCIEVIQTGSFFLFRPANTSRPTRNLFLKLITRLKKWSQALPGYQKTLDSLQRSSK